MPSYTPTTIAGYNDSPPPDDGSQTSANKVDWSKIKTKLGDPLETAIESIDTQVAATVAAMGTAADVDTGTGSGNVPLLGTQTASTALAGLTELATDAEANAHSAADKAMTPANLSAAKIRLDTKVATTSGTEAGFTTVPSYAKRITLMFDGVSTSGNDDILIQIGDSGGYATTGYAGGGADIDATPNVTDSTAGFLVNVDADNVSTFNGHVTLNLMDASTNTWTAGGVLGRNASTMAVVGGTKSLSATCDRIRITTVGGSDTFDAGSVNISYE